MVAGACFLARDGEGKPQAAENQRAHCRHIVSSWYSEDHDDDDTNTLLLWLRSFERSEENKRTRSTTSHHHFFLKTFPKSKRKSTYLGSTLTWEQEGKHRQHTRLSLFRLLTWTFLWWLTQCTSYIWMHVFSLPEHLKKEEKWILLVEGNIFFEWKIYETIYKKNEERCTIIHFSRRCTYLLQQRLFAAKPIIIRIPLSVWEFNIV